MTENTENLVLELLRQMRSDIAAFRSETNERLAHLEVRLAAVKQTLGSLFSVAATDRETMTSLTRRVERIERRLELSD